MVVETMKAAGRYGSATISESSETVFRSVNIRLGANPKGAPFTPNDQAWLSDLARIRQAQISKNLDYDGACKYVADNPAMQVPTSFNLKNIMVTETMILGPGGTQLSMPFLPSGFIMFCPSPSEPFLEASLPYLENALQAEMGVAAERAEYAPGFYAFRARGSTRNRILEGDSLNLPLITPKMASSAVIFRNGVLLENGPQFEALVEESIPKEDRVPETVRLEVDPVLNKTLMEFSLANHSVSNGLLNSYLKMGSNPSKYRITIELRLASAEDTYLLAKLLRGSPDASAVA